MQLFEELYRKLNDEQRSAVDHIEGPVLTVAGPGTGKTQILALRIANILLKTQISPFNILAITFTDSGAIAVKNRLKQVLGSRLAYQVNVHTFHSLCTRIISENPEIFSYKKDLSLLDTIGTYEVIREILTINDYQHLVSVNNRFYLVGDIVSCISTLKKEDVSPGKLREFAENLARDVKTKIDQGEKIKSAEYKDLQRSSKLMELSDVYEKYMIILHERDLYDYDDTILFVLKAFSEHPDLLLMYQERFQYFLVDEFQDTNNSQNELIMTLSSYFDSPNLFVVGDDDQSIYRFQGASVENILKFKSLFADLKEVVLRENYRSGQRVLDVAGAVVANNKERVVPDKQIVAAREFSSEVIVYEFDDSDQEGYFLANKIKDLIDAGVNPEEIAVLVRKNSDIFNFIEFFDQLNIPYFLHAGKKLMDEKVIQLIIDVFEFAVNPKDDHLLFKILSHDKFKFSDDDLFKIYHAVVHKPDKSILELNADDYLKLDLSESDRFVKTTKKLRSIATQLRVDTSVNAFRIALHETGILDSIIDAPDYLEQLVYINSLFTQIRKFHNSNPKLGIADLLEKFRLIKEHNINLPVELHSLGKVGVQIMTAHKSKGLEFKHVFVPICIDGNWSRSRSRGGLSIPFELVYEHENLQDPLEEERRLFYVALTRAKDFINISYAKSYKSKSAQSLPSEFIDEIPKKFIKFCCPTIEPRHLIESTLMPALGSGNLRWSNLFKSLVEEYIKSSFRLSPTSLNNFINCKKTFLYHDILRVPSPKSLNLFLGSAVHRVLELHYKSASTFNKSTIEDTIDSILQDETLSEADASLVKRSAIEILSGWISVNPNPPDVLFSEYNFGFKNIHVMNVPVTGKIDRIDLVDTGSNQVKLVDYKVSRPKSENQILGRTKDSNKNYLNQLLFYLVLCKNDPSFMYKPVITELIFLRPDGNSGKYVSRNFNFTDAEILDFEKFMQEIYNELTTLKFLDQLNDQCECEECLYANY